MKAPDKHYSAHNVRRSLLHYLTGRGITAIASVTFNILLVRALSIPDYGAYIAVASLTTLMAMLSSVGLDRVLPRFLPELRIADAVHQLERLCWKLLGIRLILITLLIIPLTLFREEVGRLLSITGGAAVMNATIVYTFAFAISAHISRTQEALLLQRDVATGLAIEWFTKVAALLFIMAQDEPLTLEIGMWIHAGTALLALLYKLAKLRQYLKLTTESAPLKYIDIAPERLWRLAWHNYLQGLVLLPLNPNAIRLFSANFLGATVTAGLGFAYNLISVLHHYVLPGSLMLGLIEPTFMARYSERKDFRALNQMGSIVLKVNLCLLAPLTVWLFLSGSAVIGLITIDKYNDTVWLICVLLVATTMDTHTGVLELVTNAVEETWFLLSSNLWAAMIGLLQIGALIIYGLPGLAAMVVIIAWFRNHYLIWALRSRNYHYKVDWSGIARIVTAAVIAGSLGSLIEYWVADYPGSLLAAVITGVLFLLTIYVWKPFTPDEQSLLNRFAGRKIF